MCFISSIFFANLTTISLQYRAPYMLHSHIEYRHSILSSKLIIRPGDIMWNKRIQLDSTVNSDWTTRLRPHELNNWKSSTGHSIRGIILLRSTCMSKARNYYVENASHELQTTKLRVQQWMMNYYKTITVHEESRVAEMQTISPSL
jgi:hypothetical protein